MVNRRGVYRGAGLPDPLAVHWKDHRCDYCGHAFDGRTEIPRYVDEDHSVVCDSCFLKHAQ